jgi:hypothetical protein
MSRRGSDGEDGISAKKGGHSEDAECGKKKGGLGTMLLLGGGCAVLLACLICSGGGVGIWYWKKPPGDQVVEIPNKDAGKVVDNGKAKPLGKAPETDLDPPVEVWDFTLRVPKRMVSSAKNKKGGGPGVESVYAWYSEDQEDSMSINIEKIKVAPHMANLEPLAVISMNRKFKSKPKAFDQFDTVHMPQAIQINGLSGARTWTLHQSLGRFGMKIEYLYRVEDRSYSFMCFASSKAEATARQNAELVDVSICTFRKR